MDHGVIVLARTPGVLKELLDGLPETWTKSNEGPETWTPYDVVGHLIHGERTDWIPRARLHLAESGPKTYEPFDRFAQFRESRGKSLSELLGTFADLRRARRVALRSASAPVRVRKRAVPRLAFPRSASPPPWRPQWPGVRRRAELLARSPGQPPRRRKSGTEPSRSSAEVGRNGSVALRDDVRNRQPGAEAHSDRTVAIPPGELVHPEQTWPRCRGGGSCSGPGSPDSARTPATRCTLHGDSAGRSSSPPVVGNDRRSGAAVRPRSSLDARSSRRHRPRRRTGSSGRR